MNNWLFVFGGFKQAQAIPIVVNKQDRDRAVNSKYFLLVTLKFRFKTNKYKWTGSTDFVQ